MIPISNVMLNSYIVSGNLPEVKSLLYKKSCLTSSIRSIKENPKECRPFIVADLETVLENNIHKSYTQRVS